MRHPRHAFVAMVTALLAVLGALGAVSPAPASADPVPYYEAPRTIHYSVRAKGDVGVSVRTFARLAQQTYDDQRGWSGRALRFVRVARGGDFTLWIAEARLVPGFSGGCDRTWSCRVGRNVVINADRWRYASKAWKAAGRTVRDYQHLVVNHETGHWLGFGHARCGRKGAPAPVMMQQSKGTAGCHFNPWPTTAEIRRGRIILVP